MDGWLSPSSAPWIEGPELRWRTRPRRRGAGTAERRRVFTPDNGVLYSFIEATQGTEADVLRFARRHGVPKLCRCGLPQGHTWPSEPCHPLRPADDAGAHAVRLDHLRRLGLRLEASLRLALALSRGTAGTFTDWKRIREQEAHPVSADHVLVHLGSVLGLTPATAADLARWDAPGPDVLVERGGSDAEPAWSEDDEEVFRRRALRDRRHMERLGLIGDARAPEAPPTPEELRLLRQELCRTIDLWLAQAGVRLTLDWQEDDFAPRVRLRVDGLVGGLLVALMSEIGAFPKVKQCAHCQTPLPPGNRVYCDAEECQKARLKKNRDRHRARARVTGPRGETRHG